MPVIVPVPPDWIKLLLATALKIVEEANVEVALCVVAPVNVHAPLGENASVRSSQLCLSLPLDCVTGTRVVAEVVLLNIVFAGIRGALVPPVPLPATVSAAVANS